MPLPPPLIPPGIVVAVDGDAKAPTTVQAAYTPVKTLEFHHFFPQPVQDIIDKATKSDFKVRAAAAEAAFAGRVILPGGSYPEENYNQNIARALLASASAAETPSPDFQCGAIVTRELWSSSPPASSSDSSFDNVETHDTPEVTVNYKPLQAPVALFTNCSSPAVTEWSVSASDFNISPQAVIDATLVRVIAQHPDREVTPKAGLKTSSTPTSPTDTGSFLYEQTPDYLRTITNAATQLLPPLSPWLHNTLASNQDAAL
ncbi:hypothetical protein B0H17DRAFT_1207082 [Mycena rosella]|uniref:Uncharacterized protein n=1 Tax=Mycena rosella TaxID=1033263 RepID=A0AAD7D3I3_MYCRO|nr:hypothetical protein B0H17DRAFT_1207082 [Mycena rosella]